VGGVVVAFLLLASRPLDPAALRREYVAALCSYEGARYVWGGEMPWGIDCSGLARAALFRARVRQGLAQANPRGFGLETWRFWFRDLSATALRDGGRGYTRFLGEAESIAELDPLSLLPGDLAVTPDGIHALIYLGGSEWIDATPDYGRVVRHTPTSDPRYGYFHRPVVFLRWRCLDPL
jgi:cell wall-associated NlpC family hydrolase